jgi:Resolvase, N terminal domain/Recombinase
MLQNPIYSGRIGHKRQIYEGEHKAIIEPELWESVQRSLAAKRNQRRNGGNARESSFNTTTSMGRLTLNVLLSFAQFEREVTGERIRDKIRASKMKGMWMGGFVPLGYEAKDRKLAINKDEAEGVRSALRPRSAWRSSLISCFKVDHRLLVTTMKEAQIRVRARWC